MLVVYFQSLETVTNIFMYAYLYTFLHFKNELEVMYLEYSSKQCAYVYVCMRVCISEVNVLCLPQCLMPY